MRAILFCISLAFSAVPAAAQDTLGLAAPDVVVQSGLLKHILPRFSLKTSIRVELDPAGEMVLADAPPGLPVFQRDGVVYHLRTGDGPRERQFRDWLSSDIGRRTVESFQPDGTPVFLASIETDEIDETPVFDGNARHGAELSLVHCGRCHVVGEVNRMKGLGSTPSFAVLRSMPNWEVRFQQFYALNPHPAFTQITGVTPPFAEDLPPPIHPVEITLKDLDAILAFVAATQAADLGAPLQLQ